MSRTSLRSASALVLGLALLASIALPQPVHAAAQIVIVPGTGLTDPTVATPVGGNPGTTVGQQRLNVFLRAADIWGNLLNSAVPIRVQAQFIPQFCSATQATLGSAGPLTISGNFPGATLTNTWYSTAEANSLAGFDLVTTANDINASFNSNLNGSPACLGGIKWYYGLDNAPPGSDVDFLGVILHELAHGLGFTSFVSSATWTVPSPLPNDVWNFFLFDATLMAPWTALTPAGKAFSATNTGNLTWSGGNVTAASGGLTAGINPATGFVRMYAPATFSPGSSIAHFDTVLTPNEVMEPFFTQPTNKVGLARPLFTDIGWSTNPQSYVQYKPIPGPAGGNNLITAGNGTPGATTFLIYGFNAGPLNVGCPTPIGFTDLNILASGINGANGQFDFTINIPASLAGLTVLLQAVEIPSCQVSNLVVHTF